MPKENNFKTKSQPSINIAKYRLLENNKLFKLCLIDDNNENDNNKHVLYSVYNENSIEEMLVGPDICFVFLHVFPYRKKKKEKSTKCVRSRPKSSLKKYTMRISILLLFPFIM